MHWSGSIDLAGPLAGEGGGGEWRGDVLEFVWFPAGTLVRAAVLWGWT